MPQSAHTTGPDRMLFEKFLQLAFAYVFWFALRFGFSGFAALHSRHLASGALPPTCLAEFGIAIASPQSKHVVALMLPYRPEHGRICGVEILTAGGGWIAANFIALVALGLSIWNVLQNRKKPAEDHQRQVRGTLSTALSQAGREVEQSQTARWASNEPYDVEALRDICTNLDETAQEIDDEELRDLAYTFAGELTGYVHHYMYVASSKDELANLRSGSAQADQIEAAAQEYGRAQGSLDSQFGTLMNSRAKVDEKLKAIRKKKG